LQQAQQDLLADAIEHREKLLISERYKLERQLPAGRSRRGASFKAMGILGDVSEAGFWFREMFLVGF
jgi:hypothetical protein